MLSEGDFLVCREKRPISWTSVSLSKACEESVSCWHHCQTQSVGVPSTLEAEPSLWLLWGYDGSVHWSLSWPCMLSPWLLSGDGRLYKETGTQGLRFAPYHCPAPSVLRWRDNLQSPEHQQTDESPSGGIMPQWAVHRHTPLWPQSFSCACWEAEKPVQTLSSLLLSLFILLGRKCYRDRWMGDEHKI